MSFWRFVARVVWSAVLAAACTVDPASPGSPTGPSTPSDPETPPTPAAPDTAPALRREFRGGWIATAANIDWPSRAGLSAEQQRGELRGIFAGYAAVNLNAAIFQVRPAADALYASPYEPWSRYLTGTQGVDPGYDPLQFAVTEAHAAGLELHAWFNPFRAGNTSDTARFAPSHVWNARRSITRVYGTQVWMDPGDPEVQDRTMKVILDVVRRYDVDAVHIDDYFYPYLERDAQNRIIDFPDGATFAKYNSRNLSRADWRRDNVNRFVERLYREVHAVKPWVRVGISPFGIWRPGNPPGITGLDAYSEIYADSKLWLSSGWMDYFAPQLYWSIASSGQSFTALLAWWGSQNVQHRHLWPGVASYRVDDGTASAFSLSELSNQVTATRSSAAGATGNIFYNTTSLAARGAEVSRLLQNTVYATPAIPPATPWLDDTPPAQPAVTATVSATAGKGLLWAVDLTPPPGEPVRWWVVQYLVNGQWVAPYVLPGDQIHLVAPLVDQTILGDLQAVAVWAADAVWNLSTPAYWRRPSVVVSTP